MIVEATYLYHARVRLGRKRASEKVFRRTIPVEIREVSAADAAPVFRFHDPAKVDVNKPGKGDVRFHDGMMVAPTRTRGAAAIALIGTGATRPDPSLRATAGWLGGEGKSLLDGGVAWPSTDVQREVTEIEADGDVRDILDDDSVVRQRALVDSANALVMIAGDLYSTGVAPVLHVLMAPDGATAWVTYSDKGNEVGLPAHHVFRMDAKDHALAAAARLGRNVVDHVGAFDIMVPEALTFPYDEAALLGAARALVAVMAKYVAGQDDSYFATFRGLRDSIASQEVAINGGRPGTGDEFAAALETAMLAEKARDSGPYEKMPEREAEIAEGKRATALRDASMALVRWDGTREDLAATLAF